jgi:hypothetical protein
MGNAGLSVKRETVQRQKHQLDRSHQQTVEDYINEYVICLSIFKNLKMYFLYFTID